MKNLKYVSLLFLVLLLSVSCKDETSIQQFYVDSENNDDYLMIDIPTSIVSLPDSATPEVKQAYNSIDKVNLLAFKINETNKANFQTEKTKVLKILKNPSYIELMRVNSNGRKVIAKYVGTEDHMEEALIFVSDNNQGFALARVLGDDMKPENMIKLLNSIQNIDTESGVFSQVERFFK